jgi:hypothetical protein
MWLNWLSGMNASTAAVDEESAATLRAAYARNLTVLARIGNPRYIRDSADDHEKSPWDPRTNYTSLAAAYARVVASLPRPQAGSTLYVAVGNELNACNEWRCSSDTGNLTRDVMASEVASFMMAVASAIKPLRSDALWYGHAPIASWETMPCACGSEQGLGGGELGLEFLKAMVGVDPTLYDEQNVDFLVSHSYPFSNTPYDDPKAQRGLVYYRKESALLRNHSGPSSFQVVITETGWCAHCPNSSPIAEADRANWTSLAFSRIWNEDQQVLGVCPFLLAGDFWEKMGWPWVATSSTDTASATKSVVRREREPRSTVLTPKPVFNSVRFTRCTIVGGTDC